MIQKLQSKFIALSMLSLLLVLLVIMGSINLLNYRGIVEDADAILAILEANNGVFPKMIDHKGEGIPGAMSPELPYEARYFSVLMDSDGNVVMVDTGKIAAVDTESAIAYAQSVLEHGKQRGFQGDYRYVQKSSESETRVIFLDCGRNLSTCRTFLLTSLGISLLGLLAVLCLMLLFSGRIVKPVSESYEKQKRFITDAGHEIKTPLAIINADVDVLELDLGENEWLQDIQKQTGRLAELTNSLICLSRMEEDQNQFQMIDFPVSDVVSETAQSFQTLAKIQGKTFTCQIQPMLSLHGDEKAIRQLLSILLDNALKYCGETGAVSLSLERQGRATRLCVFNTAESITPENLAHMFDRFYRADPSRNSKTAGYGIGLSIADAIVAAHKGKIIASSQDGHSLLISVTFPG